MHLVIESHKGQRKSNSVRFRYLKYYCMKCSKRVKMVRKAKTAEQIWLWIYCNVISIYMRIYEIQLVYRSNNLIPLIETSIETTIELNSNMSSSTANSAKNCKATILFIRNRFPYMSRSLIYVGLFFLFTVKQLFQTLLNFVLKSFAPTGTIKSTRRLFWK